MGASPRSFPRARLALLVGSLPVGSLLVAPLIVRLSPGASTLTGAPADGPSEAQSDAVPDAVSYEGEHWSLVPPARPDPPNLRDPHWVRDDLDAFVLARLEAAGLAPVPEAQRVTWLRRVTFDLTGLPPTLAELDAFLADRSPDAYGRAADRLLASPSYGERMAVDWLDLARYADTYGYQNDFQREVWPWRDWVIRAFNSNLPYDDFVLWQLAGDLLPDATRDQRLATTFNRLHRQTNEGGSVEEEYRVEYVSDRVHTFGTAFMGLTLECARCHDHKFDPIGQREYYALSAFFAQIDECGLYSHFTNAVPTPTLELATDEERAQLAALEDRISAAEAEGEAKLGAQRAEALESSGGLAAWLATVEPDAPLPGCLGRYPMDGGGPLLANAVDGGPSGRLHGGTTPCAGRAGGGLELTGDDPLTFPDVGHFRRYDPFSFGLWLWSPDVKPRAVVLHRSKSWTDSGSRGYQLLIEEGRLSASLIHFWPGNALRVRTVRQLPVGEWVHVAFTYDGSSRADGMRLYVDGELETSEVVRDGLTRMIIKGAEGDLTIGERFRDQGFARGRVDDLAVFDRELAPIEVRRLFDGRALTALLPREPASWSVDERADVLAAYLAGASEEAAQARAELRELRRERDHLRDGVREIMAMREMAWRRPTYFLERGHYDARGEELEPDTPTALTPFPPDQPRNRLGLARWLTARGHPLTARVAANRLWQIAFGRGLVETAEDFGTQGTPASHPALLDYLACELVDGGWDVKATLRRLVLSATYRQSSRASAAARALDPENRLYSRAPSRRLPAEMVRDAALAAGGLLVERIGGPSVKPYQPEGLWKEKSGQVYQPDEGEGLWRRSLYTLWKRTSPPPAMMIFDAAKRDVCVARRQRTETPLQALVLMNDPQYVEAARGLGERMLRHAIAPAGRAAFAFRTLTSRRPTAQELAVLVRLYADLRADLEAAPDEVERLLAVGKRPADPALDRTGLATCTLIASTLLAHDATITRR